MKLFLFKFKYRFFFNLTAFSAKTVVSHCSGPLGDAQQCVRISVSASGSE